MDRLPFDPSHARGPADLAKTPSAPPKRDLTVSELAGMIKTTLEERLASPLRVIGQVGNLSKRSHWYFSLKDDGAVVNCVAWASSAKKFGFVPGDGDEVIATGHVSHYPPQGRTQFYVSALQPVGAGALQRRFQQMCAELRERGYFDPERKKALPLLPGRIAVITSSSGAAVHDVLSTAKQRCCAVGLLIVDARVQGAEAAEDIAKAIQWVDRHHARLGVDAILVTRGGGSMEDLWAFNERVVADAAFTCSIPLVAAIGHESDTTVIELVADLRAATPTQAVMRLMPSRDDLVKQIDHHQHRLTVLVRRMLDQARHRLYLAQRHLLFADPHVIVQQAKGMVAALARDLRRVVESRVIRERGRAERCAMRLAALRPQALVGHRQERLAVLAYQLEGSMRRRINQRPRVDDLARRLNRAVHRRVELADRQIVALDRELTAVDPRQVLRRGYSFTTDAGGTLIRSIRDVVTGQEIRTNFADGIVHSVVGQSSRRPLRKRRGKAGPEVDQMDLFDSSG